MIFAGRRGVVSGVSSENSLGFVCAAHLSELGAEVMITSRSGARGVKLDARDEASIDRAFEQIAGPIDFLIHTLMHVPEGLLARPLVEVSRADYLAVIEDGAYSLAALARRALPHLERSSAPRIVTITSGGSDRVMPSYHVAGVAKAALEATVRYLAAELGPRGILVNAVCASLVATDGAMRAVGKESSTKTVGHLEKRAPTRRAASAADVARAVAYFAGPLASNVTGEVLTVDGGYHHLYF